MDGALPPPFPYIVGPTRARLHAVPDPEKKEPRSGSAGVTVTGGGCSVTGEQLERTPSRARWPAGRQGAHRAVAPGARVLCWPYRSRGTPQAQTEMRGCDTELQPRGVAGRRRSGGREPGAGLTPCPSAGIPPRPSVGGLVLSSELSSGTSLDRRHWTRIFSVALFVEHVLLGVETRVPELRRLVTEFVFLLDKVGARGRQGAARARPKRQSPA